MPEARPHVIAISALVSTLLLLFAVLAFFMGWFTGYVIVREESREHGRGTN